MLRIHHPRPCSRPDAGVFAPQASAFTVLPAARDGEALLSVRREGGPSAEGLPAEAVLEYEVELRELREVQVLCDGLLLQKTLVRAPKGPGSWELPGERAEVRCSWRGEVEATGFVFRGEAPFRYSRADASLLRVWRELKMKRGEVAELKVAPELAYGPGGEPELGVPPGASLLLRVAMGDWNDVEDVSPGRDGSALKVVESRGEGWQRPMQRYVCTLSLEVEVRACAESAPEKVAPEAEVTMALGGGSVEAPLEEVSRLAGLGAWGVGAALDVLLPTMQRRERAVLRCSQALVGGPHERVDVRATLSSWVRVEPVPHTAEAVVRTVLVEAEQEHERPNEDARCEITFAVRAAGSGALLEEATEPVSVVQGDGAVIRAIDAALLEMKRGEVALLRAPAAWCYGEGSGYTRPAGFPADEAEAEVEAEVRLVGFERGKEAWAMSLAERLASQLKKKEQGNALFRRGEFERALRRYEASNSRAPEAADLAKAIEAASCGGDEEAASAANERKAAAEQVRLACLVNMAACQLRLGEHGAAAKSCSAALDIAPGSAKALFRRGQARLALAELSGAKEDLLAAAKADPKSREVRAALTQLKAAQGRAREEERGAFGGIFT